MIQPQTQTPNYWVTKFAIKDADIEQLYTHLIEVERPETAAQLARVIIHHRLNEERQEIKRRLSGRQVYQPQNEYEVGDQLVFPALEFAYGQIVNSREGFNPQDGAFSVIGVEIDGQVREFASGLARPHVLNQENGDMLAAFDIRTVDEIYAMHGDSITQKLATALEKHKNFVRLGQLWFVKELMMDVNIGHMHLAEAVLDMASGGPLTTAEIMVHLDLDPDISEEVRTFSTNYALFHDHRFDEVAPANEIAWFLRRLQPEGVQNRPERLAYDPIPYDRALLSPQLLLLERELDDEWSDFEPGNVPHPVVLTLTYPHRWAGTLPFSSRVRPLFPASISPRQLITFVDEQTGTEIPGWVVQYDRYIYGLQEWYAEVGMPVGGFVTLRQGPETGVVLIGCDRRRGQREWVRLATVVEGQIKFDLHRRTISCGFDDLMIVGTDFVEVVDVAWRRAEREKRSVASLLAAIFPELANLNPQNTVHAKTLYSALNMFRRVPPGPLFAELVRQPAFQHAGDHYWQFDRSRWTG